MPNSVSRNILDSQMMKVTVCREFTPCTAHPDYVLSGIVKRLNSQRHVGLPLANVELFNVMLCFLLTVSKHNSKPNSKNEGKASWRALSGKM